MPGQDSSPKRARVLIVEDDELMYTFYRSLFHRYKEEFDCQFEKTGTDAARFLRENQVDAVIMDWDMPGINGIQLIKAIRSYPPTKNLRIVMISGRSSVEEQIQALKSGADEYLSKPFDVDVLLTRLRALLRR